MFRFLLILSLLMSVACHKKEEGHSKQSLRLSINEEPTSLDPRNARGFGERVLLQMLFEGLTRSSMDGKVEMAIAQSVDISEDGLRYQFHLRPSVWSDGTPLTSADFIASWKTVLDPKFPTDNAYHLFPIKNGKRVKIGEAKMEELGVFAPNPETVIVELEQPTPYFLELVSMPPFFPVPERIATTNPRWAFEAEGFVSNGPFSMKAWSHADQISLKKNLRYWSAREVQLDQIDLFITSADTALRMFEEGKIDWTGSPLGQIPVDAVNELKEQKLISVSPFLATYFVRVNFADPVREKRSPLVNPYFRRALALSLDREAIVGHLLQGGQKRATAFVPPEMGLSAEGYFNDCDVKEAERCLQKALEEMGPLEPIVLSYYNNERNASIAQALQKQWEDTLHISVEIEAVEPKIYFQRISKRDFQLAMGSWTADFNDPVNFLEVFKYKENGANNTGWEDPGYIDLLNSSQLCRDLEERKQILREAEGILMDQMPLIPLYHSALNYLKKEELDGVILSPLGQLDLRWAHWELEKPPLQTR